MSDAITVTFDLGDLLSQLKALGAKGDLILARCLNRGATSGKVAMTKAVSEDTGIASKNVGRVIVLDKANRTRLAASLTIKGSRIPLIAFQAKGKVPTKGTAPPVTAGVRGGARKTYPHAFIATVANAGPESNWHQGVFVRATQLTGKSVGAWGKNLPIKQLYGPSLPHVFEKQVSVFERAAQESLLKNLTHELEWDKAKETSGGTD